MSVASSQVFDLLTQYFLDGQEKPCWAESRPSLRVRNYLVFRVLADTRQHLSTRVSNQLLGDFTLAIVLNNHRNPLATTDAHGCCAEFAAGPLQFIK